MFFVPNRQSLWDETGFQMVSGLCPESNLAYPQMVFLLMSIFLRGQIFPTAMRKANK